MFEFVHLNIMNNMFHVGESYTWNQKVHIKFLPLLFVYLCSWFLWCDVVLSSFYSIILFISVFVILSVL